MSTRCVLGLCCILFWSCSSDGDPAGPPGEPEVTSPKREYVVLTHLTEPRDIGIVPSEIYHYDAVFNLERVDVTVVGDDIFREASPIAFSRDENNLLAKVTTGYRTFNDMVEPTDFFFEWERVFKYEDLLPIRLDTQTLSRRVVLGGETSSFQGHSHILLFWDKSQKLQSRQDYDGNGDLFTEWTYDFTDEKQVEIRSVTRTDDQVVVRTRLLALDDRDRVSKIEVLATNDFGPISLVYDIEYLETGEGSIHVVATSTNVIGQEIKFERDMTFTYEMVEEPGIGAFVLDPELGLRLLSPLYFPYGLGYGSITMLQLL